MTVHHDVQQKTLIPQDHDGRICADLYTNLSAFADPWTSRTALELLLAADHDLRIVSGRICPKDGSLTNPQSASLCRTV